MLAPSQGPVDPAAEVVANAVVLELSVPDEIAPFQVVEVVSTGVPKHSVPDGVAPASETEAKADVLEQSVPDGVAPASEAEGKADVLDQLVPDGVAPALASECPQMLDSCLSSGLLEHWIIHLMCRSLELLNY